MKTLKVLEATTLVLEEHWKPQTEGGGVVTVIPVVLDRLGLRDPSVEVLRAAVEAEEGAWIEATDLSEGRALGTRDALADQLEARFLNSEGEPLVRITQEGDFVQAEVSGAGTPETMSDGLRVLAGAFLAPFTDRARSSELVVLAYDESVLEGQNRINVWDALAHELSREPRGQARTIVALAGAVSFDPSRHCNKGNTARIVVGPDYAARRNEWSVDRTKVKTLAIDRPDDQAISDKPAVLFLGAGFSISSGKGELRLPLGNGLRDKALDRMFPGEYFETEAQKSDTFWSYMRDQRKLLAYEDEYSAAELQRRFTLERVLHAEQQEVADALGPTLRSLVETATAVAEHPGPCVNKLSRILESGRKLVLVTVNFDEILESNLAGLVKRVDEFGSAKEVLEDYEANGGEAPLFKLHGTISDENSMIATVGAVAEGLDEDKANVLELLCGDKDNRRRWIYLGASMRDIDIFDRHLAQPKFAHGLSEHWVSPVIDPAVRHFIDNYRVTPWNKDGIESTVRSRAVTLTSDVFMDLLAQEII